jgi:hypothetical protein
VSIKNVDKLFFVCTAFYIGVVKHSFFERRFFYAFIALYFTVFADNKTSFINVKVFYFFISS